MRDTRIGPASDKVIACVRVGGMPGGAKSTLMNSAPSAFMGDFLQPRDGRAVRVQTFYRTDPKSLSPEPSLGRAAFGRTALPRDEVATRS